MSEKPRWDGGFAAARQIADEILEDYLGPSSKNDGLSERIAEALVTAFDDGMLTEHNARADPKAATATTSVVRRKMLTELLREHGIGILSLEELQAITLAVAREELKLPPDEPKLSFSSIEAMVACLKRAYKKEETEDLGNH
jgi:hypothetical protein